MAKIFHGVGRRATARRGRAGRPGLLRVGVSPDAVTIAGTARRGGRRGGLRRPWPPAPRLADRGACRADRPARRHDGPVTRARSAGSARSRLPHGPDRRRGGLRRAGVLVRHHRRPALARRRADLPGDQPGRLVRQGARPESRASPATWASPSGPNGCSWSGSARLATGLGVDWALPAALWLLAGVALITVGQRILARARGAARRAGRGPGLPVKRRGGAPSSSATRPAGGWCGPCPSRWRARLSGPPPTRARRRRGRGPRLPPTCAGWSGPDLPEASWTSWYARACAPTPATGWRCSGCHPGRRAQVRAGSGSTAQELPARRSPPARRGGGAAARRQLGRRRGLGRPPTAGRSPRSPSGCARRACSSGSCVPGAARHGDHPAARRRAAAPGGPGGVPRPGHLVPLLADRDLSARGVEVRVLRRPDPDAGRSGPAGPAHRRAAVRRGDVVRARRAARPAARAAALPARGPLDAAGAARSPSRSPTTSPPASPRTRRTGTCCSGCGWPTPASRRCGAGGRAGAGRRRG